MWIVEKAWREGGQLDHTGSDGDEEQRSEVLNQGHSSGRAKDRFQVHCDGGREGT